MAIARTAGVVVPPRKQAVNAAPFVGFLILVNATIFAAGTVWTRRLSKRAAIERAAEFRDLFKLEPLPPPGDEVQILVDDERGMLAKLDAVHWPYLGWIDAQTLLAVEEKVLGWRWHPFRERPHEDPATWSREMVAAELERLYGSGA